VPCLVAVELSDKMCLAALKPNENVFTPILCNTLKRLQLPYNYGCCTALNVTMKVNDISNE